METAGGPTNLGLTINEKVKEFEKPLDVLREFKNTGTTRGGASISDIKNFKENKLTYKYSLVIQ